MTQPELLPVKRFLLAFSLFLLCCPAYSQYRLAKVEEFKVNSLLEVDIVDYSPKSKLYLGFVNSPESERILLINKKGEIVADKKLKGQGPNQYVSNLNCLGFSDDGDIWLQTVTHLLLYDQTLSVKKRMTYPSSVQTQIFGRKEAFSYFYPDDTKSGVAFVTNASGTNSYMPNAKTNSNLIEVYNSASEKEYRIAPVSDRMIFKKLGNDLASSLYFIVYSVDRINHRLFLTTRLDDEITQYDLRTGRLESRIKINHGEFKVLKLSSISLKDLSSEGRESLGARNHKVFTLGGNLLVLDYIREIPSGIYEKKKLDDPTYHHHQDASYHRLIFFSGGKQVSEDIPMPKNGVLMASLPENQLLFKIKNPDIEEDFIRYEVYKVEKE